MSKRDDIIEPLLTPEEAAKILKTSVKTVHRRIKSRALPAIQDGRVVRIHATDLRTYIAAHRCS
jgi:excisionase family DNA binding protein